MTARHIVQGVMQHTGAKSYYQLWKHTGLNPAMWQRMFNLPERCTTGIGLAAVAKIHRNTGLTADQLLAWFELPNGAQLQTGVRP